VSRLGDLSGPVLDAVAVNSDGRCIRFTLAKTFPQAAVPPWTGRFHPPAPPEPRAARTPGPETQQPIEIHGPGELTPEQLAKERN